VSASWIAGSVRARLLVAERRLGRADARALAASPSFGDALVTLGRGPYRRGLTSRLTPEAAQRAAAEKVLVELRLLAGWLPPDALGALRALAGWFELANVEDRLAYLAGAPLRPAYELGGLAVAWPRIADAQSVAELRAGLVQTAWGDPDGRTPEELGLGLRLAWARRVCDVGEAASWASSAAALLLAREIYVAGVPVDLLPLPAVPLLGDALRAAATFEEFVASLPPAAARPFAEVHAPSELWRGEQRWWALLERDADVLLHTGVAGRSVVVGAVALLAADAHRVSTALAAAARRGLAGVEEAFDDAA
jgi:hypothetical protein